MSSAPWKTPRTRDAPGRLKICDAIVHVEQNSDMALRTGIPLTQFREFDQRLDTLIDAIDCLSGGLRIVLGDELEDVLKPPKRLFGPNYFRHDRIRRAISSFEVTRCASESASPRSTIT
jgi:hypothetical protein